MNSPARNYLPLREVNWLLVAAVFVILFIFFFFYRYLEQVAVGGHYSPTAIALEEFSGITSSVLIFPFVYWGAIRFPLVVPRWRRNLGIHLFNVCLVSFFITNLMWLQRWVLFPLFGLGAYDYGYMPVRYPMEFAKHFIFYWFGLGFIYLLHEVRFAREQDIQRAKLEAGLAEAQAQNLRLQLEPHFLFNTLNAISAAVYENPQTADRMICGLSDLLRLLLKKDSSLEVPLATELELLELYAEVMKTRLEHRFRLELQISDEVKAALVPQLLLQPLLENVFRHGMNPLTFQVYVSVSACLENEHLRLQVRDHGSGFDFGSKAKEGIGLRNTRQRLMRLYEGQHQLILRNAPDGGAIVEVSLPFRVTAGLHNKPTATLLSAKQA